MDTAHDAADVAARGATVRGPGAEHRVRHDRRAHRVPGAGPDPDPGRGHRRAGAVRRHRGRGRAGTRATTGRAGSIPADLPAVLDPPEGFIVAANQAVTAPGTGPFLDQRLGLRLPGRADPPGARPRRSPRGPPDRRRVGAGPADGRPDGPGRTPSCRRCSPCPVKDAFTRQAVDLLRRLGRPDDRGLAGRGVPGRRSGTRCCAHLPRRPARVPVARRRRTGGTRWSTAARASRTAPGGTTAPRSTSWRAVTRSSIAPLTQARLSSPSQLGKDPTAWRWGRLHRVALHHPVLGGGTPSPWPVTQARRPAPHARRRGRLDRRRDVVGRGVGVVRRGHRARRCGWSSTWPTGTPATWVNAHRHLRSPGSARTTPTSSAPGWTGASSRGRSTRTRCRSDACDPVAASRLTGPPAGWGRRARRSG